MGVESFNNSRFRKVPVTPFLVQDLALKVWGLGFKVSGFWGLGSLTPNHASHSGFMS